MLGGRQQQQQQQQPEHVFAICVRHWRIVPDSTVRDGFGRRCVKRSGLACSVLCAVCCVLWCVRLAAARRRVARPPAHCDRGRTGQGLRVHQCVGVSARYLHEELQFIKGRGFSGTAKTRPREAR